MTREEKLDQLLQECEARDNELRARLEQLREGDDIMRSITERLVELSERSSNPELLAMCKRARDLWAKTKVH